MIYAITVTVYPFPPDFDISSFVSFYSIFSRPDLTLDETVGLLKVSPDIISGLRELSLAKIGIPRSVFFSLFGDMAHHILIFARVPASACALHKKNLRCGCLFLF